MTTPRPATLQSGHGGGLSGQGCRSENCVDERGASWIRVPKCRFAAVRGSGRQPSDETAQGMLTI